MLANQNNSVLQEDAQRIITMLKRRKVPMPSDLNLFTSGDSFRQKLVKLQKEILVLHSQPGSLEIRVLGNFGTGKTHFLTFLEWMLQRDEQSGLLFSSVDLSNYKSPDDLQYLIVTGLRDNNGSGYATVLRTGYESVRDWYVFQNRGMSQQEIAYAYGSLLFLLLGQASGSWINKEIIQVIGFKDQFDRLTKYLAGKTAQSLFNESRNRADKVEVDFVDRYLELVQRPNVPLAAFEEPARALSKQRKLTDVIFKVLGIGQTKVIIILMDELESLAQLNDSDLKQCLVSIRELSDSLSKCYDGTYPSVALICASTDIFYRDKLKTHEPGLYDRWNDNENIILITPPTSPDIDGLIFKLRDLFYLAGENLRSVNTDSDGSGHEVTSLRNKMLTELQGDTLKTRELVPRLINEIERRWID